MSTSIKAGTDGDTAATRRWSKISAHLPATRLGCRSNVFGMLLQ